MLELQLEATELARWHDDRGYLVWTLPREGINEHVARQVREEHNNSRPMSPLTSLTRIPCATSDLLLIHLDVTIATYKRRQVKHLKQASKILVKTLEKHLKTIANICNIQMKHSQT
jgi:hypothetical protein